MNFLKKAVVAVLILESRLILAKYKPFIVAVTGSVGKTSTKDAIYDVLSHGNLCGIDGGELCYVRKSDKSFNSEIGLPLTVIGVPNAWRDARAWMRNMFEGLKLILVKKEYPDCLVLEMGADHPGDIRRVAQWLHPDISVITQVSSTPVHVEFFESPEHVFEEKAALATAVKPGGTLVLFADNPKVMTLAERVAGKNVKVISFGTSEQSMVRGSAGVVTYTDNTPSGLSFTLNMNGTSSTVSIPGIIGHSYLYPLLAAAAVGLAKNVSTADIIQGLHHYEAPKSRMRIIAGLNGATIIDDTYNSSPDAVISALRTLASIQTSGRKIAALGDMLELGQYAAEEHRKIGREVIGVADLLITVGQRSRATADEAIKAGLAAEKVTSFDTSVEAADYIKLLISSGDVILVKGSQSIRMERIVTSLMDNPADASRLVARQEREWLEKK